MLKNLSPYKATCAFAAVFVVAHLVAAVLLCRERLFLDTAYYFFHVVNEGAFHVEHQRVVLVVSQVLLWAGVKAHLNLYSLLVLYSITPVLFTAVLLFACLYYFKNETGAWLVIFCNVCGTYFLYYSPMYEVCYATIGFAFLWFLTEQKFYQTPLQILLYTLILGTCLLGYPLIAIGCGALLAYYWVADRKVPVRLLIIYTMVFVIWLLIKTFLISDYEKSNVTVTATNDKVKEVVLLVFSLGYICGTLKYLLIHYLMPFATMVAYIAWSWNKPHRSVAIWLGATVAILLLIINLRAGGEGLTHFIHNERSYLLIVPLCLIPFLFGLYPTLTVNIRLTLVVIFILASTAESLHTWQHSSYYTNRLDKINSLTDKRLRTGCSQSIANYHQLNPDLDDWSIGMEALIFSSMRGKGCILSDSIGYYKIFADKPIDNQHFLIRLDEVMSKNELNYQYFSIDSGGYCK